MSDRDLSAYRAGLRHAADMALLSALALELRPDATHTRQQAAIAALRGLAEGLMAPPDTAADPMRVVFTIIATDPSDSGIVTCPECSGRLRWMRDSHNGHLHGQCETEGCLRWMQ